MSGRAGAVRSGHRWGGRRALCLAALALLVGASSAAGQNCMWLSRSAEDGGLYATPNPAPTTVVGHQVVLYLWISKTAVTKGYDGISLNVQVTSDDGGQVGTQLEIDNQDGRWFSTYTGNPLSCTGGTGIDTANAIDLTNTDTIPTDPFRFARLTFTAEHAGTVKVFLGIGGKGIADNGSSTAFYIGMSSGSTYPEPVLVAGSNYGATSNVPEAVITIMRSVVGDFDGDSDVDLADFVTFQACFNGPNRTPRGSGCGDADGDLDGDVDLADFAMFQACFHGPNRAPACISE